MVPQRRGGAWTAEEFFATGEIEVREVIAQCRRLGVEPDRSGAALDFGCGPGRLTRALASEFDGAVGFDAAGEMAAVARRLNADVPNAEFVNGVAGDALGRRRFAFVCSSIVLQHLRPRAAADALAQMCRATAPGGLLVAGVCDHVNFGGSPAKRAKLRLKLAADRSGARRAAFSVLRTLRMLRGPPGLRESVPPMHPLSEASVREVLGAAGMEVLGAFATNAADERFGGALQHGVAEPETGYVARQYYARKPDR